MRWNARRLILAGRDGGGVVVDLAAGTIAVDAGTAIPEAWTALAGVIADRWGLARRADPAEPASGAPTARA